MRKTTQQWQSKPGDFNTLHAAETFPSSNKYGIPDLQHTPSHSLPVWLARHPPAHGGGGRRSWRGAAVFTTALTFGLQWIFYSQPGNGAQLIGWQVILFASIVPIGLAIMAWHHQWQAQEIITDWQAQAVAAHRRADEVQAEAVAERQRADGLQTQVQEVQAGADGLQQQVTQMQVEADAVQSQRQEMQTVRKAWHALNEEVQTLALFNAQLLTAKEAATTLAIHETTVRRRAKQLNGVKAAGGVG